MEKTWMTLTSSDLTWMNEMTLWSSYTTCRKMFVPLQYPVTTTSYYWPIPYQILTSVIVFSYWTRRNLVLEEVEHLPPVLRHEFISPPLLYSHAPKFLYLLSRSQSQREDRQIDGSHQCCHHWSRRYSRTMRCEVLSDSPFHQWMFQMELRNSWFENSVLIRVDITVVATVPMPALSL